MMGSGLRPCGSGSSRRDADAVQNSHSSSNKGTNAAKNRHGSSDRGAIAVKRGPKTNKKTKKSVVATSNPHQNRYAH